VTRVLLLFTDAYYILNNTDICVLMTLSGNILLCQLISNMLCAIGKMWFAVCKYNI